MCHSFGSSKPTVVISGPTAVASGATVSYTLTNNGTPNSGLDVAASAGTFTAGSSTQLMNGDITQLASLSSTPLSWTFNWKAPTVTTSTTVTLYGASISAGIWRIDRDRDTHGHCESSSHWAINHVPACQQDCDSGTDGELQLTATGAPR